MHEAGMSEGSRLTLVVAFYLSKFDSKALTQLGYSKFKDAYVDIGNRLAVKPSSVKNKRDDFDPLFENSRAGWHQRNLGPSRLKVLNLFNDLSFDALTGIVKDILERPEYRESAEVADIVDVMKKERPEKGRFIPRAATGRMAEDLFAEWFRKDKTPFKGDLEDVRDTGCGYDFLISDKHLSHFVEVKGVAEVDGGLLMTDKEWQTALSNPNYAIALFVNIRESPELHVIRNPAAVLVPKRLVNLTVSVTWQVSKGQIFQKK